MKRIDKILDRIAEMMLKAPMYFWFFLGNIMDLHRRTEKDVRKQYQKQFSNLYYHKGNKF